MAQPDEEKKSSFYGCKIEFLGTNSPVKPGLRKCSCKLQQPRQTDSYGKAEPEKNQQPNFAN